MAGYVRQSVADLINGADVTAPPLTAEFNQLASAFDATTGHTHDGGTGAAPPINLVTSVSGFLQAVNGGVGGKNNTTAITPPVITNDNTQGYAPGSIWEDSTTGRIYICVGNATSAAVWRELVQVTTGNAIIPSATDQVDLGTPTVRFQDLFLSGGATLSGTMSVGTNLFVTGATTLTGTSTFNGSMVANNVDIGGGNIDGTQIGSASASTITGTTVTASNLVGPLAGSVTGNVTGNTAGVHTGAVTGDLTGNVTASSGASSFNDVTINGSLDLNVGTSSTVTGLSSPVADSDAATKGYVDQEVSAVLDAAPAALDTLNELAAALNDDANFAGTVTDSIALKLPLAGGTMSGALAMGTSKITGLGAPTAGTDAATKTYVDTGDNLKITKTGDTMSGILSMGSNKITGVADPTTDQDAATKAYVDVILGSATAAATSAGNASTSAGNAANSESNASDSAADALVSENNAAASLISFTGQYVSQLTAPSSPDTGDLWFDETTTIMKVYDGATFVNAGSTVNGVENSVEYTATASQTTFAATYDVGYLHVFQNGFRLDSADYTAIDGTSVVLGLGAAVGDTVYIQSFGTFELADHYNKTDADARYTTETYVDNEIASLVDSSPSTLDTLNELAAALGDDPNFATTVTTSIGNKLPLAGGTMTGDVSHSDNVKAKFGADDDLQIYHDGSDSVIKESGTGHLRILAEDFRLQDAAASETYITAAKDGAVGLRYNDSEKLATTSTGVDVTGTVTADGLDVTTGSGDATIFLQNVASARGMKITKNYDDFSAKFFYSLHPSTEAGSLAFKGSQDSTQLFINANGDISFYEDTGTTPKFFWDASAESLGIGTSSPSGTLHVSGGGTTTAAIIGIPSVAQLNIGNAGGSTNYYDANTQIFRNGVGSERLRIDSSGNVGIGNSSPTEALEVFADDVQLKLRDTSAYAAGTGPTIGFQGYDSNSVIKHFAEIKGVSVSSDNGALTFGTRNAGTTAERLRIDSAGNVGIGTSSPTTGIHLSGETTARRTLLIENAAGQDISIKNAVSGGLASMVMSTMDTEAMRIDSSGNVGIGTSSPATKLHINGGRSTFYSGDNYAVGVGNANGVLGGYLGSPSVNVMSFSEPGGVERMRIDSGGQVIVGGTTQGATESVTLSPQGYIYAKSSHQQAGIFDRDNSDGAIVIFRKQGTAVGSIGTYGGDTYIYGSNAGLRFRDEIRPANSDGSNADGTVDLGDPNARFKDAYLSGGVYLGGTGAANKLDDYEEGTWTPTGVGVSLTSPAGTYTKLGRLVTVTWSFVYATSGSGAAASISGLPFNVGTGYTNGGNQGYVNGSTSVSIAHITASGDDIFYRTANGGVSLTHADFSGATVRGSLTYQTA